VDGFRFSILFAWLSGDVFKLIYFFTGTNVALQFKVCAFISATFDSIIGWQFYQYKRPAGGKNENNVMNL